jgi:hypothetical protein
VFVSSGLVKFLFDNQGPGRFAKIGLPVASAALGPTRDGLVVYLASTGDEFDVFGTPIACASPR